MCAPRARRAAASARLHRHRQRHWAQARRDQAAVPSVRAGQRRDRAALWRHRARACRRQGSGQADGRRSDRHQPLRSRLEFPSLGRARDRARRGGGEARRRNRPAAPARPLAVLCVEDNPYGRVILNTILTELGHRADFVGSGEEAVAAVARGYDAVLMDVTLPGIDGLETDAPHPRARRHRRP